MPVEAVRRKSMSCACAGAAQERRLYTAGMWRCQENAARGIGAAGISEILAETLRPHDQPSSGHHALDLAEIEAHPALGFRGVSKHRAAALDRPALRLGGHHAEWSRFAGGRAEFALQRRWIRWISLALRRICSSAHRVRCDAIRTRSRQCATASWRFPSIRGGDDIRRS